MRSTCHGCTHLKLNNTRAMVLAYCGATPDKIVVPHASEISDDNKKWELTFWRVPMSCGLPDSEVHKSEKQAPRKAWAYDTVNHK